MQVEFINDRVIINGTLGPLGQVLVDTLNYDFTPILGLYKNVQSDCDKVLFDSSISNDERKAIMDAIGETYKSIKEEFKNLPFYKYDYRSNKLLNYASAINRVWDKLPIPSVMDVNPTEDLSILHDNYLYLTHMIAEFQRVPELCLEFIMKWNTGDFDEALKLPLNELINIWQFTTEDRVDMTYKVRFPYSGSNCIDEIFQIDKLGRYTYIELFKMIQAGNTIRRCKNCRKYFLVTSGRNIEYCDNIPEGETRPCSEIGSLRSYAERVKGDPLLTLYNRAYKTHYARRKKTTGEKRMTPNEFATWCDDAKLKLEKAQAGEITMSDFASWLKI